MKFVLILTFGILLASQSKADTFERVEIIGANEDGNKIAVIKSHFGPSSYAPFVGLYVFKARHQLPLFSRFYASTQGGEDEISQMKQSLIAKNKQTLSDFGVQLRTNFSSVDALVTDHDNQFLIEADLFKSGEISRFSGFLTNSSKMCEGSSRQPIAFQFCAMDEAQPARCSLVEPYTGPTNLECYADKIKFSRALRINNYLWFLLFLRVEPLEGLYYYSQVLHGEKL